MTYIVMHNSGAMDADPPLAVLPDLLDELADAEPDHPDVAVSDEGGLTISVYGSGRVTLQNVELEDDPRHLDGLDRRGTLLLLTALAEGRLEYVEQAGWQPGYG